MGISGLLPQLRSITRRTHVSKYRGQTVAVDAYCLLHRGAYTCARELVEGEPTERHVAYCMTRIDLLVGAGVTPLVVFDGGRLPNKADEERSRQRSREENRARARALWSAGNRTAAMECYQKSVDITPAHAKQFVEALKRRGIAFIVAPYEADAQMAYLALNGLVDAVLTEDSDLLCYGCPRVFFKMDKTGEGEEVQLCDLPRARELSFLGFGHDLFQEMCVLAGCDFVDSLPGIGIKKAHQHLRRTRCFLKVVRALRFDGTKIPEGYERRVQRALWTFKHQRVYCPHRRAAVHLHEVAGGDLASGARVPAAAQLVGDEPDFLGPALPDEVAHAIAIGELDPITKQPFVDELQPSTAPLVVDAAASGRMPSGHAQPGHHSHPLNSGPGKGALQQQSGGGGNGATLLNFGFVRGLAKPAPAGFRPPRPSSASGSQDSGTSAAGVTASQQQQQRQGSGCSAARQDTQQQQGASPPGAKQAPGGDRLASPTDEQWQKFRQRRHKSSGRAAPGVTQGAGKPGAATTSSYFASKPSVPGMRRPAAAGQGGGSLLARLRAALQPEEPSVDELLRGALNGSTEPCPSVTAPSSSSSSDAEVDAEAAQPGHAQQAGRRPRFVVPLKSQKQQQQQQEGLQQEQVEQVREQQQQQQQAARLPTTPLDLGLRSSPTIDDLLGSGPASASVALQAEEEPDQLPSLACSPARQPLRPSQRLWLPQRAAPAAADGLEQHNEAVRQLDLVSPAGPAFLQQLQHQEEQGHQVTPGFYLSGGSEAGSDVRRLTSLPRHPHTAMRAGQSSPAGPDAAVGRDGEEAAALQQCFDAAALAAEGAGVVEDEGPSAFSEDPIASLHHLTAFQREAGAAVDRAARSALAAASQAALRPLPPPPAHLQANKQRAAAVAAGKRALLGAIEKENGQAKQAASSKRAKGGSGGGSEPAGGNLFAGFVCT